ncbi:MAG TPA: pyridoxine 5'-phosphate synthase [Gammaproteobacteria bacterium]|nr:pyridoxine 5'-phosphate synthase [Gammaproteobacteria bacterium]
MTVPLLGVNIDHIATLRRARGTRYPDPVEAAFIAERAGADGITLHLREDRRHIQERDVRLLKQTLTTPMNLELAAADEVLAIAVDVAPEHCCLVPEKRQELTTEGGLDVKGQLTHIGDVCKRLAAAGVVVSLFIDPDESQVDAAAELQAPAVEIHTGRYADAITAAERDTEFERVRQAVEHAHRKGLTVNGGHGLHYHNVKRVAALPAIQELNIGHSIVARAVLVGLDAAVREMKSLVARAAT